MAKPLNEPANRPASFPFKSRRIIGTHQQHDQLFGKSSLKSGLMRACLFFAPPKPGGFPLVVLEYQCQNENGTSTLDTHEESSFHGVSLPSFRRIAEGKRSPATRARGSSFSPRRRTRSQPLVQSRGAKSGTSKSGLTIHGRTALHSIFILGYHIG